MTSQPDPPALPPPPFWRTAYFERDVMNRQDRAGLRADDVLAVLAEPARILVQPDGRMRYWGYVERVDRWLRVVTLADSKTVHNAFFDRSFKP